MYKIYKYNNGKLAPQFDIKPFDSVDEAMKMIRFYFETRRGPKDVQFAIATEFEIVKTVKFTDI